MISPRQFIEIRGERVELLLTPSLNAVAIRKGWVITATEDWAEIQSAYIKIFYCAIINAYEVGKFDNPDLQVPNITLLDMECWAAEKPLEFGELIKKYIEIRYNKTLEQLAKEKQEEKQEQETQKKKKNSPWWKIGALLKPS